MPRCGFKQQAFLTTCYKAFKRASSSKKKCVRMTTRAHGSQKENKVFTYYDNAAVSYKIQKPVRVVFDLDCLLISDICPVNSDFRDIDKILLNIGEESVVESCGYYFYLYNGWKELLKYVMELSDNNLLFFSSGAQERNEDIIPKMLARVLERDPTEYMRDHVKIFSRHHTIDTTMLSEAEGRKLQPVGMYGQKKKDLTVLATAEEMKYTLLIDDDESYAVTGQEKNLLRVDGQSAAMYLENCIKMSSNHEDLLRKAIENEVDALYTLNKLFYAAGVLRDVCEKYSRVDRDLVDIVWDDHGFNCSDNKSKSASYKLLRRFELFQSGLELLKEINSDVCFLLPPRRT